MAEAVQAPRRVISGSHPTDQRHRPAWERAAADAALLLCEKRLPAPQRVVLQQELARLETVLAGIGPQPDQAGAGTEER